MKKSRKWLKRIIVLGITLLIAVFLTEEFIYQQKIGDEFYFSAIPNDSVRLGMRPCDVITALGKPDEENIMEDFFQVGFVGNKVEWRETGEIELRYKIQMLEEDVTIVYQYNKRKNRIWHVNVRNIGMYKTLEEATAIVDKLANYAETVFEQKGDYTFQNMGEGIIPCLTYRFKAENQSDVFMYEISIIGENDVSGLNDDNSYHINIYQNLFQIKSY
jgi:hypothetical protein